MGYWSELRAWLFKDPAKIIRYIVLFACCIVVIVQLYECFSKLYDPPISTHSYYSLNDTIEMPAVTICREPPYKHEVLSNLSRSTCLHPKFTNCWINYPYDEVNMDEFFQNSTFNKDETFVQYGLNGCTESVDISSTIHFNMGQCHTLRPNMPLRRASRDHGYSIMLKHHIPQRDNPTYSDKGPGWHVYIHDYRENFTEINMKGSGRVEYVFVEINEDIEIKLQTQFFSNVETRLESCSREEGYSDLKCGEECIWKELAYNTNCSGPWMHDVPQSYCSDHHSMKELTKEYKSYYEGEQDIQCECVEPCESRIFSTYIQNRKSFVQPEPTTQIWLYYTTKLISMIEERPSYDTTQFIADVGGSLGFLLGLSVLGLIGILEHITLFFCGGIVKKVQLKQEKRNREEADRQSEISEGTLDIATISVHKLPIDQMHI